MNNVISLRRPIKIGDPVAIMRLDKNYPPIKIVFTLTRIMGRALFGHYGGRKIERFITKDYKTPLTKTIRGTTVIIGVTHPDGARIQ